jgi:hypothetical protein
MPREEDVFPAPTGAASGRTEVPAIPEVQSEAAKPVDSDGHRIYSEAEIEELFEALKSEDGTGAAT